MVPPPARGPAVRRVRGPRSALCSQDPQVKDADDKLLAFIYQAHLDDCMSLLQAMSILVDQEVWGRGAWEHGPRTTVPKCAPSLQTLLAVSTDGAHCPQTVCARLNK